MINRRHYLILILIFLPTLFYTGCASFPGRGYAPYQWGNVIDPLTQEEFQYFYGKLENSNGYPILLTDDESKIVYLKLRGPVKDSFGYKKRTDEVWLTISTFSIDFYKISQDLTGGYSSVSFSSNGEFFASGGGQTIPKTIIKQKSIT